MEAGNDVVRPSAAQCAIDLHSILSAAVQCGVYEGEAPRDASGVVTRPPFVVYAADFNAPTDEAGVFTIGLIVDVWALGSFVQCYDIAQALDDALDGQVYEMASGLLACDRNGLVMSRQERDPEDPRIRRMQGQYLVRYYPM